MTPQDIREKLIEEREGEEYSNAELFWNVQALYCPKLKHQIITLARELKKEGCLFDPSGVINYQQLEDKVNNLFNKKR